MALVKYNNNSISAITAASSLPTGAMTLIKTLTASGDGDLSFVDGADDVVLDSTYPIYVFKFINIHPGTSAVFWTFQANASGGSGYNETITSTTFRAVHTEAGSGQMDYIASIDQAEGTAFQNIISDGDIKTDNDSSLSGTLTIFSPSSTTFVKHFMSRVYSAYDSADPIPTDSYCSGYFNTTSAIDEIQFKFASGNIDAGDICLYGITT